MSDQTGFSYEVMISRLHGGLCAFQSLRAHRRQREQAAAPTEPIRVTPEPSRPPRVEPPAAPAPQAFVNLGDRAVPTSVDSGLFGVMPPPPSPTPAPTPATPAPPVEPPPPQSATAPMSTVSTLKLPPPTPPPRLGLIYGGHAAEPAPTPATATTTSPPPTLESLTPRPQDAAHAQEAPSLASLTALLDTRARAEAQRLDQVNTDHRAALATLLSEHRDELRAQAEADADRTAQLLREVLADHRAEQARAAQTHADHLAQLLTAQPSNTELKAALLEQATLQREANEDVADHISALTTIVADLGQTVGMLAVAAAHKAHPSHLPTRPIFTPPAALPRVDPVASAALPPIDPLAATAAPSVEPARVGPAPESSAPPPVAATHKAESSQARSVSPNASLSSKITDEPAHRQPFRLKLAQEAADRARMAAALEDDSDDDLATAPDDDDPLHPRPLAPCTAIEPHNDRARNV